MALKLCAKDLRAARPSVAAPVLSSVGHRLCASRRPDQPLQETSVDPACLREPMDLLRRIPRRNDTQDTGPCSPVIAGTTPAII